MTPRYRALADTLRERIVSGELTPGQRLPSAAELAWEHDVGRDTALKALGVLRGEGLLFIAHDNSIRVGPARRRPASEPEATPGTLVRLPKEATLIARMPTPREREELGLPEGTPVLVVRIDDVEEVHAADRTAMRYT
ncbi:GntR family transcriptional regulator [Dactylosporangium sucinum]|uniref:GntR family transcriptional regulator n=1 Tax=Dactylosporangium sucinum TaxID=1424081 RepID=UPI001E4F6130|nr:GntR family transcriptional regulator [Dactylosporangium sucinum]